MDVCFYSQGNTQKLSTNVKYNSSPRISNSGRIVGWGSDHLNSPSTVNIYRSLNSAAAEQVAVNGVFPNINMLSQIVCRDENAHQLVLLTPSAPFPFWMRILRLILDLPRRIWSR